MLDQFLECKKQTNIATALINNQSEAPEATATRKLLRCELWKAIKEAERFASRNFPRSC